MLCLFVVVYLPILNLDPMVPRRFIAFVSGMHACEACSFESSDGKLVAYYVTLLQVNPCADAFVETPQEALLLASAFARPLG